VIEELDDNDDLDYEKDPKELVKEIIANFLIIPKEI
jgi:hypothetical protein